MTDNPNKRGKQDRALIASKQPYEVRYFARKWGLTASEARAIIKERGPSRDRCNKAAADSYPMSNVQPRWGKI